MSTRNELRRTVGREEVAQLKLQVHTSNEVVSLKEFVEFVVKRLVDKPEEV